MRISSVIRQYKRAIYDCSAKSHGLYEIQYLKLSQDDRKLASAITGRLACKRIIDRKDFATSKLSTTLDERSTALILKKIIMHSRRRHLDAYLPLLTKISRKEDIYKDTGSCPREVIRGIKRCIEAGALK